DVDPDQRCLAFCDEPHAFLPMSRALTCASCPVALNNGDSTRWQHAAAGRAPHCAIGHVLTRGVTPCPPASVADTSIYCATPHAPPRPQDAADVTLPPFAPLVAAAGPPGHRRGARRRRVAVLRRVLAPARGGQPAQRRAP